MNNYSENTFRKLFRRNYKGFTLLELLLVIAGIVILAAILIFTLNPLQIFQELRDTERASDLRDYYQTTLSNPDGFMSKLSTDFQEICDEDGKSMTAFDCVDVTDELVPDYMRELPRDPSLGENDSGTGYYARLNPDDDNPEFYAPLGESREVFMNVPEAYQTEVADLFDEETYLPHVDYSNLKDYSNPRLFLTGEGVALNGENTVESWTNDLSDYSEQFSSWLYSVGKPTVVTQNGRTGVRFFGENQSLKESNGKRILSQEGSQGSTVFILATPAPNRSSNNTGADYTIDQGFNAGTQQSIGRSLRPGSMVINDPTDFSSSAFLGIGFAPQTSYLGMGRWNFQDQEKTVGIMNDNINEFNTGLSDVSEFSNDNIGSQALTIGGQAKVGNNNERFYEGIIWGIWWFDDYLDDEEVEQIEAIINNRYGTLSDLDWP